ncbi:unnamed protein product [Rhizophagus irregularis]|nr:unnamed protein product [Rhizophagus irregularis]
MSGSQPRVHATQSSTRQQQDKEDWQPASSRKTKRKDKEKQVEQKQQKKQPHLSFRQHKSTEKTTDDMDISQDTLLLHLKAVAQQNPIQIINDNHSEIFNKAKPILVKIKKDSIPGNNIIQKKFNLRKQLAGINVTLARGVILNKKEPKFIILPIMKNDYDKIINLEIDIIDDEQSHENGEDAESSTNKENGFYTRIRILYIQAFITYKKEESLQKFYKGIWSEWIGKHQVLIVPKILSEDKIEKRSMYTVKLTGLPWNSTAYNIHEALEVNNPKYIFISRNPNNNKPLNYAIVYYENDEDIGIAAERNIIFCNRMLHWETPGEKSCHRCGSFDHLISKCDIEPSAKLRVMNRKQKLKEFRQENNKKFKKGSYANVTKQNSFEKRQQKNKSTTSSGKNIKVNQDRSTIALQNENNKRSRVDNEQLEASGSSDIENSLNKQNNEINRFGDALSTMSKNISKTMEYFTSDNNNDVNNFQGDKIIDNNESHED